MKELNINKIEENVLEFWEKHHIFEQSVERRQKGKPFVFFEGPPTANGHPGIHHFFGRTLKDLFCRYKTMRGFYVPRKSGWDTHGLPVEIEVEKELGLKSKKEIEHYGVAKFNAAAKKSVWKYKDEWEKFTKRIGFWIDLKDPYVSYDPGYVESLWWAVKKIWDKKLLYKGHKVVPFCVRCGTPVSSHEVAQGYRTITDQSVIVKFLIPNSEFLNKFKVQPSSRAQVEGNPNIKTYILAWTTTPWTLPGNVALAVGEKIKYVLVRERGQQYILAKERLDIFAPGGEIVQEFFGKDLVGLAYEPLFKVKKLESEKSYKIYPADFVTTEEGTGVVHTAVMYGEDDYQLGIKVGLPQHHTVGLDGKFTADVPELEGHFVKAKETEDDIIAYLKNKDLLYQEKPYEHDYPFCWRCNQPLLYYATDSWFIAMSKLEKELRHNNSQVSWYPAHLKEGRFGEWLKGVKDWAVSRTRYWGTPLPIWECRKHHEHRVVAGSLEDLEKMRPKKRNQYFLMRHGFSTKNTDDIISSKLTNDHYPLTAQGRTDVEKEAKKLTKVGVDVIYTSPFLRTKETAEVVAKFTGAPVHTDQRLRELDHGAMCEGESEVKCLSDGVQHPPHFDFRLGDGESWNDVRQRMADFIREVDAKYEGKNIVIVGHGDPLAILGGVMGGWSDEELLQVLHGDAERLSQKKWFYPEKGRFYPALLPNWPWDERGFLNLHRPYIDEVVLRCPQCGEPMKRVKEVMDIWFDSGAMPFAQWHYPFENKTKFSKNFPADFISEGIDQTRGWFYTLLALSTLLGKGPAYKNVISYSHVLDEKGQKMSKSKGNTADPWAVVEKYGADAARWYFYSVNNLGEPKFFSMEEVALRLRGMVMTLWNGFRFFELYNGSNQDFVGNFHQDKPPSALDQWLVSRLHQTIKMTTAALDQYDPTTATRVIECLVIEDFSQWWLRRSRSHFQRPDSAEELKTALSFLRFFLLEISKIIAPFMPFMAEHLHHELHRGVTGTESVHWHDWPKAEQSKINLDLEKEMELVQKISNMGLAIRQQEKIKVRQPLRQLTSSVVAGISIREEFQNLLKDELNVKGILISKDFEKDAGSLVIQESSDLKIGLDINIDQVLRFEGWAREIVRQIQDLRKEAQYHFSEKIFGQWFTDDSELKTAVEQWAEFIQQNSLLKEFSANPAHAEKTFDLTKEFELAPGKKIWLGIKR